MKIYFAVRAYNISQPTCRAAIHRSEASCHLPFFSDAGSGARAINVKNPETPLLRSSSVSSPDSVLRTFPSRALSAQAETRVNVENFRHYIDLSLPFSPFSKSVRAISALNQLSEGARPILTHCFRLHLPQIFLLLISMVHLLQTT